MDPSGSPAHNATSNGVSYVTSKRQQKKLAKKQERKAAWAVEKAKTKTARSEVRQQDEAERKAAFDRLPQEEKARILQLRQDRLKKRNLKRQQIADKMAKARKDGPLLVIDLDFDQLMTENEIVSLTQQISFCQAINTKAERPLALELHHVSGRIQDSLELRMSNYTEWQGAEVNEQSYVEAYAGRKADLVYLTADADDALQDLDPGKIYVLGGIVDRNRHKGICSRKAGHQGIKKVRLPLQEQYKLRGSAVLTVDQVFQLLLHFHEMHDWKAAISKAIPARKLLAMEQTGPALPDKEPEAKSEKQPPGTHVSSMSTARPAEESTADLSAMSKRPRLGS